MIESASFQKLKFTQGDNLHKKENSWLEKLEAIEEYIKTLSLTGYQEPDLEDYSGQAQAKNSGLNHRLRFKLEFHSTRHESQSIPTTTCLLTLYEQFSDSTLHPILSQEALEVLYLESSRKIRTLSPIEEAWLHTLTPYFLHNTEGELRILLPTAWEVGILKTLCAEGLLFYFDFESEPQSYEWVETAQAVHFMPQLQKLEEEWKLWGKFIDSQGNTTDLWDIQAATPGGVVRQSQQLFEYRGLTYPWIETFLSGGAIRCPEAFSREFLYRLLCLFDPKEIEWPANWRIESVFAPLQPVFYVKTRQDKRRFKTKIEGFAWFRSDSFEYPSEMHKDLKAPPRPKVIRVNVQTPYQISIQVPNLEAEHQYLRELEDCAGLFWNGMARSFSLELLHATRIFYDLLRRGWEVWAENLQVKILKEMEIQLTTQPNWFEIDLMAGNPSQRIPAWQLIHLLKKKRLFIQLGDGSLGLLPEHWYQEFEQLFALRCPDLPGKEDTLRFSTAHAFHFAKIAEMAENSEEIQFKGDPAFEQIRHELLNINGLKPLQPASSFQLTLRPYQEMGLSWLHFLGRARLGGCLADDMGLGKTVQVLAYLDLKRFELSKAGGFKSLLVCPRSLLENWFQEAKKCAPRLRVRILRSSDIGELDSLLQNADLLLISYGLARVHIQALQKYSFDLLALDEAQIIKNSNTQITMAINQLQGVQRLAISGTPIENHMGEFFSLFEFLNPGLTNQSLLKTLSYSVQEDDSAPHPMVTQFLKGIRPLILRRLKSEVAKELPEKLDQVLVLPMNDPQTDIYLSLRNYYQEQLKKQTSELFYDKSFFLEGLLRLRQVACHPLLFEHSMLNQPGLKSQVRDNQSPSEVSSNKFEFLINKLKTLVSSDHKAIVFSQFTSLLKLFRKVLDELAIRYEYLDGQSQDRMEIVTRFQENEEIPIFLVGMKTGGLGLNLTAADYCFILDPWWNPAIEQQAVDRIHRIGQDKTVNIYRLVSQNTVEEKMLLLKEKKQKIADQLMTANHSLLEQLRYEDFQFLFD